MPLTEFQSEVLALLAASRSPESYLAGGAALHFKPNSTRYSEDLDFFHDSSERVAKAFSDDSRLLEEAGYELDVQISQPGFVRATVTARERATRIDWAHETAWRFLPLVREPGGAYLLHEVDLALNKTLTLAGRDEPRDFVDLMFAHESILALGGLVWAAVGKDPGFSPGSLLELLKRRGRPRPEEIARLRLAVPFDLQEKRVEWLAAVEEAERFVESRPAGELGCLYFRESTGTFVLPSPDDSLSEQSMIPHFGAPGGVVPTASADGG